MTTDLTQKIQEERKRHIGKQCWANRNGQVIWREFHICTLFSSLFVPRIFLQPKVWLRIYLGDSEILNIELSWCYAVAHGISEIYLLLNTVQFFLSISSQPFSVVIQFFVTSLRFFRFPSRYFQPRFISTRKSN